jgi:hypothetical protein
VQRVQSVADRDHGQEIDRTILQSAPSINVVERKKKRIEPNNGAFTIFPTGMGRNI